MDEDDAKFEADIALCRAKLEGTVMPGDMAAVAYAMLELLVDLEQEPEERYRWHRFLEEALQETFVRA
jgi:hypothetical protein